MIVRPRLRAVLLATITALAVLSLTIIAPASAAQPISRYVALGDSYSSGPLIPLQRLDPLGCFRSDHNYPSLLASALSVASFTDVSCGGATTADMTNPQSLLVGQNPPQLNALTKDTSLVTVSIGGNDIGFIEMITTCLVLSLTDPFGAPCEAHYTAGGNDVIRARILAAAPKIAAVLQGIRKRAPEATVVVVGYLRILPSQGGCWPVVPIAAGDVPYFDGIEQSLNDVIGTQAAAIGATFVDTYTPSIGHDSCQLPGTKWVEGYIPTAPAFPVHPNAEGMAAVAKLVQAALH